MKKLLASVIAAVIACGTCVTAFADDTAEPAKEPELSEIPAVAPVDETPTGEEDNIKGDVDGDGEIDIVDAVSIINHINAVYALDNVQLRAADFNSDDTVDIEDVVYIIDEICGNNRIVAERPEQPVVEPEPEQPVVEPEPEQPPEPEKPVRSKRIDVKVTMQNPELPTGCEITSLTIALNHAGYDVDKITMATQYLPRMDFYYWYGTRYGADFTYVFAGNPNNNWSYGCLAPCIVDAGNKYLSAVGSKQKVNNLTGTEFDDLLKNYISKDKPVLVWITSNELHPMYYSDSWYTPDGKYVTWPAYEHCVVLTGFDLDKNEVYTADPMAGSKTYPMELFKQRYIELGKNSVVIE